MASILIRNLDTELKRRLRIRAAEHGRSMEEEARELLRQALYGGKAVPGNLAIAIRQLFEPLGGMDLEIPLRTPGRAPPDFSE